jgi:Flp pilus assembly protein TadG
MKRTRWIGDERGIALAQTVVGLMALMGLTVVGTDLGRLAFTATEVQTAAEVAATAAAKNLINSQSPDAGALALVQANNIDGTAGAASNIDSIETGSYEYSTGSFSAGGTPATAVRATTSATINNLLAGIFGSPQSLVTKSAIAAFTSIGSGEPTLPLVIGDCEFPGDCYEDSCLPTLLQVPNTEDNTAWTGFFEGANNQTIGGYFQAPCGDGSTLPGLSTGDSISLNNGQIVPLLDAVQCLLDQGINEFLIPVVECNNQFNQGSTVVGFATVVVDSVDTQGNPKGLNMHAIFTSGTPGPPGGGNFGTGFIAIVG